MSFDYIAWHVRSSGDVRISDYGVSSSYGRPISPYTSTVDRGGAWGVMTYGDLINGYNIVYVYSYGRRSPTTNYYLGAWRVNPSGNVYIDYDNGANLSYGINKI